MKTLVVVDEFATRSLLMEMLSQYGMCDTAVNGRGAVEAVELALKKNDPYQLIYLDIMMPEIDGQETLIRIRELEESKGIRGLDRAVIIMTTCLNNTDNLLQALSHGQCDAYLIKPVIPDHLTRILKNLELLK